jgi:hypothetical protein
VLTWRRVLLGVAPAERAVWQDSVPGWTAEHLEPGSHQLMEWQGRPFRAVALRSVRLSGCP